VCTLSHAVMPIVVEAVPLKDCISWVSHKLEELLRRRRNSLEFHSIGPAAVLYTCVPVICGLPTPEVYPWTSVHLDKSLDKCAPALGSIVLSSPLFDVYTCVPVISGLLRAPEVYRTLCPQCLVILLPLLLVLLLALLSSPSLPPSPDPPPRSLPPHPSPPLISLGGWNDVISIILLLLPSLPRAILRPLFLFLPLPFSSSSLSLHNTASAKQVCICARD
jgi:hypothetical protein